MNEAETYASLARLEARLSALDVLFDERVRALKILIDERDKQVTIAFNSAEKASGKAEQAQRAVNESQNEFRGTLRDQAGTLASKESLDQLDKRVQSLEKGVAGGIGRSGGLTAAQTILFQVLPLLISAIALVALFLGKGKP